LLAAYLRSSTFDAAKQAEAILKLLVRRLRAALSRVHEAAVGLVSTPGLDRY
jgi:hypothetical protein